jgi:hypothetical protein
MQAQQFAISINGGITSNSININNFDNYFTVPVSGYISDSDSLIIPSQVLQGNTVYGSGYYNSNAIQVSYTIISSSGVIISVNTVWKE